MITQKEVKLMPASVDSAKSNPYVKTIPTNTIDIYRVLKTYEVEDPCIQHAVKKLLCAGKRGSKDYYQDIDEALQSLLRFFEMEREECFQEM
jgi:hypothetical protein